MIYGLILADARRGLWSDDAVDHEVDPNQQHEAPGGVHAHRVRVGVPPVVAQRSVEPERDEVSCDGDVGQVKGRLES